MHTHTLAVSPLCRRMSEFWAILTAAESIAMSHTAIRQRKQQPQAGAVRQDRLPFRALSLMGPGPFEHLCNSWPARMRRLADGWSSGWLKTLITTSGIDG